MHPDEYRTDRLLIFDLDGTLYRTESSFIPTMRAVYAEYDLPYPSDETILGLVGEPFPVFLDWLAEQGFDGDRGTLTDRITEIELASIRERGALFPGVRKTLDALRARGYVISLATNGDMEYAEVVLSAMEILPLFDELQTHEVEGQTKVGLVRELLQRVSCEKAFMVGDRYHDMEAGRANGCAVIGARYGYGPPEELAVADRLMDGFSELPEILEELASTT